MEVTNWDPARGCGSLPCTLVTDLLTPGVLTKTPYSCSVAQTNFTSIKSHVSYIKYLNMADSDGNDTQHFLENVFLSNIMSDNAHVSFVGV